MRQCAATPGSSAPSSPGSAETRCRTSRLHAARACQLCAADRPGGPQQRQLALRHLRTARRPKPFLPARSGANAGGPDHPAGLILGRLGGPARQDLAFLFDRAVDRSRWEGTAIPEHLMPPRIGELFGHGLAEDGWFRRLTTNPCLRSPGPGVHPTVGTRCLTGKLSVRPTRLLSVSLGRSACPSAQIGHLSPLNCHVPYAKPGRKFRRRSRILRKVLTPFIGSLPSDVLDTSTFVRHIE